MFSRPPLRVALGRPCLVPRQASVFLLWDPPHTIRTYSGALKFLQNTIKFNILNGEKGGVFDWLFVYIPCTNVLRTYYRRIEIDFYLFVYIGFFNKKTSYRCVTECIQDVYILADVASDF